MPRLRLTEKPDWTDAASRLGRHAVPDSGGDHAVAVAAPVEQAEHGRGLAQPAHRDRAPRIHPELQRLPVPPHRQQPGLQRWPHVGMLPPPSDIPTMPVHTSRRPTVITARAEADHLALLDAAIAALPPGPATA